MRNLFLIVLIVGCCTQTVWAQLKFNIHFRPDTTVAQPSHLQLALWRYEKGRMVAVDTVAVTTTYPYKTTVSVPTQFNPGLYILSFDGGHRLELILTKGEQFTVSGSLAELKDGVGRIDYSFENEAYYQFMALSAKADAQAARLQQVHFAISTIEPRYYERQMELEEQAFQLQKQFNKQLDSLQLLYSDTYVADKLVPVASFPAPSVEQKKHYQTNTAFLFTHYFNTLSFDDEALPDNHIFHNRIRYYLQSVAPEGDEHQQQAIDHLLKLAELNTVNYEHMIETLIGYYYNQRRDELVLYVYERYTESNCTEGAMPGVEDIVTGLSINRPGDQVRELTMPDTSGTNISLLKTARAHKATILLFWSSHCSVCMGEFPFLTQLQEKYSNSRLAIYAVNLDVDRNDWINVIRQAGIDWIHVNEFKPWKESQVEQNYKIRQTPTLYLINEEGIILSKGLFGSALETSLSTYFNQLKE